MGSKDTARYWAAGAADVRWVVVARGQEEEGITRALGELGDHPGVVIEGNRVVESLDPDLAVMVASPDQKEIKVSARRILGRMDGLYVPEWNGASGRDPAPLVGAPGAWERPVWGPDDLDRIAAMLRGDPVTSTRAGV